MIPAMTQEDITDYLDYVLSVSEEALIHYLWRPFVADPKDDLVLEVALAGGTSHIITHNTADFRAVAALGISVVTSGEFLHSMASP